MRSYALMLLIAIACIAAPLSAQSVGSAAPNFDITQGYNLNGKTKLSDWRGSWVQLTFFLTT